MRNPYQAPALLRKTWLPVMLAVEALPALMGGTLLIGVLSNGSGEIVPWVVAYFIPGLSLYLAKFMVMIQAFPDAKSQRIMHLNGWFAAASLLIGFGLMIDQGMNLISEGGGVLWLFMIYLACATTISFLAGTGKYDLIR